MTADVEGLVRTLRAHPEWRDQLRSVVLGDELLLLPGQVTRVEAGLDDVRATLRELVGVVAQQQVSMAQQQEAMAQQHRALEAVDATLDRVARITEQNSEHIAELTRAVGHLSDRVGMVEGWVLEERYRHKGHGYFQRIARRLHSFSADEIEDLLDEEVRRGALSQDDADEVRLADALYRGRRGDAEVWLVVEVSYTIDFHDVDRAAHRARLLAQTGRQAVPVVAGKRVSYDAVDAIREQGVWAVTNGRVDPPPPPG